MPRWPSGRPICRVAHRTLPRPDCCATPGENSPVRLTARTSACFPGDPAPPIVAISTLLLFCKLSSCCNQMKGLVQPSQLFPGTHDSHPAPLARGAVSSSVVRPPKGAPPARGQRARPAGPATTSPGARDRVRPGFRSMPAAAAFAGRKNRPRFTDGPAERIANCRPTIAAAIRRAGETISSHRFHRRRRQTRRPIPPSIAPPKPRPRRQRLKSHRAAQPALRRLLPALTVGAHNRRFPGCPPAPAASFVRARPAQPTAAAAVLAPSPCQDRL